MKAVVYTKYGSPDVLKLREITTPTPADNEILVRIRATTVTPVDNSFRSARPFYTRAYTGLLRPRHPVLGTELAGEVAATGQNVTRFKTGDRIFASPAAGFGAHARFITLPQDGAQVIMPASMGFAEAAAISNGALTALPFLRDSGRIQAGQRVLINGASGSIGTFAVQLARHFGASVTAVTSLPNAELVRSLGADRVIDYTREDFTRSGDTWDIIFDTVNKSTFARSRHALTPRGRYLTTAPSLQTLAQMLWTSRRDGKKAILSATGLRPARKQIADMEFLHGLIEAGKLKTIIDRSYPLEQIAQAARYVEKGHKRGNVVITVSHEPAPALAAA